MNRRVKLTQFQLLELVSRVRQRYATLNPGITLNLNTNPANHRPLVDAINEDFGEVRISETWLRDLIIYAVNEAEGKVLSGFQLEALNYFVDADGTAGPAIEEADKRLRGKYRFVWRGTRLEKDMAEGYIDFAIEFTDTEIKFYDKSAGATYFKHHHLFLNGIDYIALMDKHHSEIVFLTLHRGQAYGTDLDAIPGLYLGADTAYLPCSGPVMLVREGIDYANKHLDRFFANYDFTSIKGQSITEVSGYVRTNGRPEKQFQSERLTGLDGHWRNILYVPWGDGYEVAHVTLGHNQFLYESRASRYVNGETRMSGERCFIITIRDGDRESVFIGDVGNYRKTENIKRFAASLAATGTRYPSFGYTIFIRKESLTTELPIGAYDIEELVAAGIDKAMLKEMELMPFNRVPSVNNL